MAAVALVILLALLIGAGAASVLAYRSLRSQADQLQAELTLHLGRAQTALEAAKSSLATANANADPKMALQARSQFSAAKLEFDATMQLADHSDALRTAENLPLVGPSASSRHRAVDGIAGMGAAVSVAGEKLCDLDVQLLQPSGGTQAGHTLLTVIDQVSSGLQSVRDEFIAARTSAAEVDVNVVPLSQQAVFLKARGTVDLALAAIDEFRSLVPTIREVLGGNGVRNYLIEQVNPAELRPGGGFIGTYSIVRADQGTLSLVKSGDAVQLSLPRAAFGQAGYVAPPGPIREFVPTTSWSFLDSNFFPGFPANAQAAEQFVKGKLPYQIDGVFAIDYYAVARLLQITGPMGIPGYPITVDAGNVVSLIVKYDIDSSKSTYADAVHKAIIAALAGPLFQRLTTLSATQWPPLIHALNDLASARSIQTFFNNPDVEKVVGTFGWSGVQTPSSAKDYIMEIEANLGGTKANYFVTRHYTLELTRSGAMLHHKLLVDVRDDMPYAYRPDEFYSAYVQLYVSATAANLRNDMVRPRYPNPAPPAGTVLSDGWINIHGYGHDRVITFEWDTPWASNGRQEQQIYWQKQPGTQADKIDVIWNDGAGHQYKVSGDLGQDRVLLLSSRGINLERGQTGTAQLPNLSLG